MSDVIKLHMFGLLVGYHNMIIFIVILVQETGYGGH